MLILSRRFFPYFAAQAIGAFTDNFYRNGLVMLITFAFAAQLGDATGVIVALCPMIFIAPYFFFSATAGHLADRFDKARLVRILKWTELALMLIAALGFALMQLWLLLLILLLLGVQAAFFGPVKYSILPPLLGEGRLLAGNGWVEASTFIVILAGTMASSLLMLEPHGREWLSVGCILFSGLGIWASYYIPSVPPVEGQPALRLNIAADTWKTLKTALAEPALRTPMLGITWFWATGTAYVAQLPYYARHVLGDLQGEWVPWLLLAFTLGVGLGAAICYAVLRGRIEEKTVLPGALMMAAFALDLYLAGGLIVSDRIPWRILIDLTGIAAGAGLYIVPLYTLLQHRAGDAARGRTIAASNILDALAISFASLLAAGLIALGTSVAAVLLGFGLLSPLIWWGAKASGKTGVIQFK